MEHKYEYYDTIICNINNEQEIYFECYDRYQGE